jgi:hypothetical protein
MASTLRNEEELQCLSRSRLVAVLSVRPEVFAEGPQRAPRNPYWRSKGWPVVRLRMAFGVTKR